VEFVAQTCKRFLFRCFFLSFLVTELLSLLQKVLEFFKVLSEKLLVVQTHFLIEENLMPSHSVMQLTEADVEGFPYAVTKQSERSSKPMFC
jgi:hypothetical protein